MVSITMKRVKIKSSTQLGSVSSMVLISLENRLRIRPEGVVSKNDIGSRRMFTSSCLWISIAAKMPPMARKYDANTVRTICPVPSAAYTPKYSPLYYNKNEHREKSILNCLSTHTHTYPLLHTHTHAHARMHTHTHRHMHTHTYTHAHARAHTHTHTHTHTYTHTYAHTHTYTHTHTHTHTRNYITLN